MIFDKYFLPAEGNVEETIRSMPPQRSVLDEQETEPARPSQQSDAQVNHKASATLNAFQYLLSVLELGVY